MTLVLSAINRHYAVQLNDRRLSSGGHVFEEEAGKSGILVTDEARMLFGFTGLARVGHFDTRRWLLNALYECAPPDFRFWPTLNRLNDRLTEFFGSNELIQGALPENRRLLLMFSGYLYLHDPPIIGGAYVTNYLDAATDQASPIAWNEFKTWFFGEKEPGSALPSFVQRIGAHQAVSPDEMLALKRLLTEQRPAEAVIGKAIDLLLTVSDDPAAGGAIGKQISWIKITARLDEPAATGYYSNVPTHTVHMPSMALLRSDTQMLADGGVAGLVDPNGLPPVAVPRVNRNARCPCGTGKRYRRCHGRARPGRTDAS